MRDAGRAFLSCRGEGVQAVVRGLCRTGTGQMGLGKGHRGPWLPASWVAMLMNRREEKIGSPGSGEPWPRRLDLAVARARAEPGGHAGVAGCCEVGGGLPQASGQCPQAAILLQTGRGLGLPRSQWAVCPPACPWPSVSVCSCVSLMKRSTGRAKTGACLLLWKLAETRRGTGLYSGR